MVSLIDVVRLLKPVLPGVTVYPLEFPVTSSVNSILVDITSSSRAKSHLFTMTVNVRVRAEHPSIGEEQSLVIRDFLEKKTNFMLGSVQVVLAESQNSVPLYMGKDLNGNYLYSNNFNFICNEGVI